MWKKSFQQTQLVEHERSRISKWTFTIKPIKNLLTQEVGIDQIWCDPMAGAHSPAQVTNDINPQMPTKHHEDALIFLKKQPSNYYDGVLFDPPYSLDLNKKLYGNTEFYNASLVKNELARIVKPGGKAICFGWNSNGLGMLRGFRNVRMLSVAHGSYHNNTLCTVEVKEPSHPILLSKPTDQQQMQTLKVPSKAITDLLNELAPSFEKLKDKVDQIFIQGRKEGFDDLVIGSWIRDKMEEHYSYRTIVRLLPQSAKRDYTPDPRARIGIKSDKMSQLPPPKTLTFEATITKNNEKRTIRVPAQYRDEIDKLFLGRKVTVTIT